MKNDYTSTFDQKKVYIHLLYLKADIKFLSDHLSSGEPKKYSGWTRKQPGPIYCIRMVISAG